MAKLTLEELESLSRLLISENDSSIELGLEILKNHKEAIPILQRELVLVWQLHKDFQLKDHVEEILNSQFSQHQLNQWKKGFLLFKTISSYYKYTSKVQRLIRDHENIRSDFQVLLERNSNFCINYHTVAKKLHQTFEKHIDLAEIYYRIVLKANPLHEDNLFYLAYLLDKYEAGYPEALKLYLTIESINPKSSATINNIGLLYDNTNRPKLAYEYYSKALALDPYSSLYIRNLASLCSNRMDGEAYKKQAKELLEKLIKIDPSGGSNWNVWADYLWNVEHDYKKAENAYLKGLSVDKNNPWLIGNLGELYIDIHKEYDRGLKLYTQSLDIQQTPYRLVTMITLLVNQYKNYGEAKIYYKILIKLSPPKKIIKNRYLRENQWNAFLAAEEILKAKIR